MASVDERYDIAIREILERFPTDRPDLEQHHSVAPHVTRHTVLLVEESPRSRGGKNCISQHKQEHYIHCSLVLFVLQATKAVQRPGNEATYIVCRERTEGLLLF